MAGRLNSATDYAGNLYAASSSKENRDDDHRNPKDDHDKPRSPRIAIRKTSEGIAG